MRSFRVLLVTLLVFAASVAAVPARASLGTNFSDQWWNPNESGRGFNIVEPNHFRATLLPSPAQLREVFARIERCLARMAATQQRHVA